MLRGFVWAIYVDDLGRPWLLRVDADYASDPARGWVATEDPDLVPLPRQWRPRRVVGVDDVGFARTAIVARTDAPLWTGEAQTFTFERTDFQEGIASVIRRVGENLSASP